MLRRAFSHIARKCDRTRCLCLEQLQSAESNPDAIDIARKRLTQCLTLSPWPTDDLFDPSDSAQELVVPPTKEAAEKK